MVYEQLKAILNQDVIDFLASALPLLLILLGLALMLVLGTVLPYVADPSYAAFTGKKGSKYNLIRFPFSSGFCSKAR